MINKKQIFITLGCAFVVWAFCGITIGFLRGITSLQNTLVIHAVAAPLFAALVALFYFRKFNCFSPFKTALIFLCFIFIMDAGIVAPVFEKSYGMFKSFLGTWLPLFLIFAVVYLIGVITKNNALSLMRKK